MALTVLIRGDKSVEFQNADDWRVQECLLTILHGNERVGVFSEWIGVYEN